MTKRLFAALLLALPWAAPTMAGQPVATEATPVVADIAFAPDGARWTIRYTLPTPVRSLRFARVDRQGHRAGNWRPLDPAFEMVLDDGEEVVRRRDGAPFAQVGFGVVPRYVELEKDYAPFSPFGDGGLLVHSGRLHACPEHCEGEGDAAPAWRVEVTPPPGAHVIAQGRVAPSARFIDTGDGTSVYIGRAEPVETDAVVAVVDTTFPAATRARLESRLPQLMAKYAAELGALEVKPMLFASRDADHSGGGYGYQGGTLPGQVFMHLYGRHESFDQPDFGERMDWFFAHEAAHLYQHYPALADTGESWIHEGGADALAAVALADLGVVDAGAIAARLDGAVDTCAAALADKPLDQAHLDGRFDAFYACGFVMQMAADAAARRASDGQCDLFCVWRDFQAQVRAGAPWSTATFAGSVARLADPATAGFIETVAGQVPAEPGRFLREGLRQAGVALPPHSP